MKSKIISIIGLSLLVFVNLSFWAYLNRPHDAQPWTDTIMGMSFNPLQRHHDPRKGDYPSPDEIKHDLTLLQGKTHAVRIYSVTNGQEVIADLASEHNLNVTAGAWIGKDFDANEKEIDALTQLSRSHRNIVRTLVGNESIMREDVSVEQLIDYIRQVRRRTWVPVSTSETWDIWLRYPEIAKEVDFIAAHILPYWEGIPVEQAVDYVFERYQALRETFPNKPIVLTEVGWPSNGQPIREAQASLANQALFLREFLNRAHENQLIYYVVEAFDQPWKKSFEGSSGAYWGLFSANRQPKFPMQGDILELPTWKSWAVGSASLSILIMLLFLAFRYQLKLQGKLFFGFFACLSASTIAWSASIGVHQYHSEISAVLWTILLAMQCLALLVILVESLEIAEVFWLRNSRRNFQPLKPPADYPFPKVSLHLPIHNEPPDMVKQTLASLAQLDYPDLEIVVVDNNTTDESIWKPVRDICAHLGPRFRFFHIERLSGFKAGALNFALRRTAKDAEIIAVIDSDYKVKRDWLKSLIPYFANPHVGFVQAPQNYRDRHKNLFKTFCHWEYTGFFHIGMVQRNEFNAIIQHGTMTLIRKDALASVGNWGEWCICEDSELGLRLYRKGYDSVYIKQSFGRGLTPDTLSGYISQRYRWAYGAVQILKRHWRGFLPGRQSGLTIAQRYYFLAGWLPWFSDALALLFTLASLILTAQILADPIHGELPIIAFLVPTLGLFCFKVLRTIWLYQVRVKATLIHTLGATLVGLALTHTVAKAIIQGLFTSNKPFLRTPKCETERPLLGGLMTIHQEVLMLALLLTGAFSIVSMEHFENINGRLWATILCIQSIPYAASLLTLVINIAPNLNLFGLLPTRQVPQPREQNA